MHSIANPLMPLSQLTPRTLTWLWPQRVALGKLAMFDGDPGRGKSMVALDLCARITSGRPMPDGTGAGEPANVIVIQGEDFADDTVLPRLQALGADLNRVFIFRRDFLEKHGQISLPSRLKILKNALTVNRPRLLVVDPVLAFLDRSVMPYSDASVRRALTPLGALAHEHRCSVVMVRHLNKTAGSRSLYRGGGSIAFNAACRSSWLFDHDPSDPSRFVMAQIKNNVAPAQESLAYQIVRQDDTHPVLRWLGASPCTCEQLLTGARRQPDRRLARDRARDFLPAFLDEGPRATGEIWQAARAQGLERRTLQNARQSLGISSVRVWNGEKLLTYWLLPGQKLPIALPPERSPDDVDDLFAGLLDKYPPDPLDEDE